MNYQPLCKGVRMIFLSVFLVPTGDLPINHTFRGWAPWFSSAYIGEEVHQKGYYSFEAATIPEKNNKTCKGHLKKRARQSKIVPTLCEKCTHLTRREKGGRGTEKHKPHLLPGLHLSKLLASHSNNNKQ